MMWEPGSQTDVSSAAPVVPTHLALFTATLCGGGAERVLVNLAAALSDRGHRVDLVLARAEGAYRKQVPDRVRVVDLGARRTVLSMVALAGYLRRERPAALLAALDTSNVTALLARRLACTGTRVVVSLHSPIHVDAAGPVSFGDRWIPRLTRWSYRFADSVVAVSRGVANEMRQHTRIHPDRLHVIYNPVVTKSLLERARQQPQHPWASANSPPFLVAMGRLTAQKDFDTLLRAFARARSVRPSRLLILGEGELRAPLEARVRELGLEADVQLPGFVDDPFPIVAHARAFVLSSAWEALPTVLIEAMACGTPVVSTRCRFGPEEILTNGRFGHLVPVGDDEALAGAILDTLEHPIDTDTLRARALEFSDEACLEQYLHILLPD